MNRIVKYFLILMVALSIVVGLSCSDNHITDRSGNPEAQVEIRLPKGALTEQITDVLLIVLADDVIIHQDTTGVVNGNFSFPSFAIDPGPATFTVTALDARGIHVYSGEKTVQIIAGINNRIVVDIDAPEYYIVLSWGSIPRDLDSHLWTRGYHVYFAEMGSTDSEPYVQLDVDDTEGMGRETTTITQLLGLCQFAVYNYSDDADIKLSGARADVYRRSEHVAGFEVPQTGQGRWWYVFDLQADGTIAEQGYITDTSPGGDIVYKEKGE